MGVTNGHSSRTHALISPSGADRYCACPGSVRFSQKHGLEEISPYAVEGTTAHELAEWVLSKRLIPAYNEGMPDVKGYDFTEMYKASVLYADYIEKLSAGVYAMHFIEDLIDLSHLAPHSYGSLDYGCYIPSKHELHVVDFKYGAGVSVSAENNKQLLSYLSGLWHKLPCEGHSWPIRMFVHIVQPRSNRITDCSEVSMDKLKEAEELLKIQSLKAYQGMPEFKSGAHCKFCTAKGVCRETANKLITIIDTFMGKDLNMLDKSQIQIILENEGAIRSWLDSVKKHATRWASGGTVFEGFKLVQSISKRVWADEDKITKICIKNGIPLDSVVDVKYKSPAQLEKTLQSEIFLNFEDIIEKHSGGMSLVPISDRRSPVSGVDAASAFKGFKI